MHQEQLAILAALLKRAPFEGWTETSLKHAARDVGYDDFMAGRAFPGGVEQCLDFFIEETDKKMLEALAGKPLTSLKIRERIEEAVMTRLAIGMPHREAIRRALSLYWWPGNAGQGMRSVYKTVDAIWRACGDTSTDFNFYTKRLLLAGVYTSTLICWLDDHSPDLSDTRAFLQRRIAEVLSIGRMKEKIRSLFPGLSKKFS